MGSGRSDAENQARYNAYLVKFQGLLCPSCKTEDQAVDVTSTIGYFPNTDDLCSTVLLKCNNCDWTHTEQKAYEECIR